METEERDERWEMGETKDKCKQFRLRQILNQQFRAASKYSQAVCSQESSNPSVKHLYENFCYHGFIRRDAKIDTGLKACG